jgi:hypothetical protein
VVQTNLAIKALCIPPSHDQMEKANAPEIIELPISFAY